MNFSFRDFLLALGLTLIVHEVHANTYNFAVGATQCYTCNTGTFSTGAAGTCSVCDPGYYQDTAGEDECKACPAGKLTRPDYCCPCIFRLEIFTTGRYVQPFTGRGLPVRLHKLS